MRILLFTLLVALTWVACKTGSSGDTNAADQGSSDVKTLEAQVMAIHDEVMPKMNDIGHLSAQLRRIKADLEETPEGKIESPDGLDQAMESLKLAEQGMWDWMKSYSDTKKTLGEDQLKSFMEGEMIKVTKVKTDMLAAIEKAQAWLAANPQPQQ